MCGRVAVGNGVAFLEFYPRSVLGIRHLPPLEGGDSFVSREPSLDTPKYPNRILRGNLSPSESDGLRFLLGFDPSREHDFFKSDEKYTFLMPLEMSIFSLFHDFFMIF